MRYLQPTVAFLLSRWIAASLASRQVPASLIEARRRREQAPMLRPPPDVFGIMPLLRALSPGHVGSDSDFEDDDFGSLGDLSVDSAPTGLHEVASQSPGDEPEPPSEGRRPGAYLVEKGLGETFSGEEATLFVRRLGGEDRFLELLEHLSSDDGGGVDDADEHRLATPKPAEGSIAETMQQPRGEAAVSEAKSQGGRRQGHRRHQASKSKIARAQPGDGKSGTTGRSDISRRSPSEAAMEPQFGEGVSPALKEFLEDLVTRLDMVRRGTPTDGLYATWVEDVLQDITLAPDMETWLESAQCTRFLLQRHGSLRAVQNVKRVLRKTSMKILGAPLNAIADVVMVLTENKTTESLIIQMMQWDASHPGPIDDGDSFEFIYPDGSPARHKFTSQLYGKILAKSDTFLLSCSLGAKKMRDLRELQFRRATLRGREVLEMRFLRSESVFPNVEPWIMFSQGPIDVVFVGVLGQEASDHRAQFLEPYDSLRNAQLPDTYAIELDLFIGEPVITLYELVKLPSGDRATRECCLGALNVKTLQMAYEAAIEEGWSPDRCTVAVA
mmetsp:Transcript_42139/g.121719  ORF Transcript_42139/g.121719 Transcript_42139/m.121719 type:complete len:556 (+) Transcript_42139:156-1823(+)